ncbi:MAG: CCA tRNA nucleotidyltransferase [Oscillospiraceae bacterium]
MNTANGLPDYVRAMLTILNGAGFSAFAVGGCVRDMLLGRTPHDWDIASSAGCGDIAEIFEKAVPTGEKYGTMTVFYGGGSAEITTYRRDGEYKNGRSPENVEFVGDIAADLSRRDFTINAMAMSSGGEITDPFGGRDDLERRLIRCVGEPERRFSEDALRMLRALRFSAALGFEVEAGTLSAIKSCAGGVKRLSAERIRDELQKTLLSQRPQILYSMIEYGLLDGFISKNVKNIDFSALCRLPCDGDMRIAALAAALHHGGEGSDAGELISKLRFPAKLAREADAAQALLDKLSGRPEDIRLLMAEHGTQPVITAAAAGELLGLEIFNKAQLLAEEHQFVTVRELAVNGDDLKTLGLRGREIGAALCTLSRAATLGQVENERDKLMDSASAIFGKKGENYESASF